MSLSIILPAKNEERGLTEVLPGLRAKYRDAEILVIDDGSKDHTREVCEKHGVQVISHPYSMGNGAAIKTGVRNATGDVLVFMDADGQHDADALASLLARLGEGFDMVIGARSWSSQASVGRLVANTIYNWFATFVVGHPVEDLTSGLRVARADRFKEFLHLLPNGFSYPTTSTMAFYRSGYPVAYIPIKTKKRFGRSHIRLTKDGVRFFMILFKVGTLYAPLKIFLPFSFAIFFTGLGYYLYTYTTSGRFTNMSASLFLASILIFLIGLVSEQITMLLYQKTKGADDHN